eukprot:5240320-Amphidinium_carterae.1
MMHGEMWLLLPFRPGSSMCSSSAWFRKYCMMGRAVADRSCKHTSVLDLSKFSRNLYLEKSIFVKHMSFRICASNLLGQALIIGIKTSSAYAISEITASGCPLPSTVYDPHQSQ